MKIRQECNKEKKTKINKEIDIMKQETDRKNTTKQEKRGKEREETKIVQIKEVTKKEIQQSKKKLIKIKKQPKKEKR